MAVVIPDKICLYFMLSRFDKNEQTTFSIEDLMNFSWKVVERRNMRQEKIDYIAIETDSDDEYFEIFRSKLKNYCDIGLNFIALKTDKMKLDMARLSVENMDDITTLCCEEILSRTCKKAKITAKTK